MPHHIGEIETGARVAVVTGDPDRVPALAEAVGTPGRTWRRRGYVCVEVDRAGQPVLVASTGIGGPTTAIAVEELHQLGVDRIVRIGTCGALQPWVRPGGLVVSTGAVRDEGTSGQYLPASVPAVPDFRLLTRLVAEAGATGLEPQVGITHCKDAFYAERPDGLPLQDQWVATWERLRGIGVLATEMEAATLFAVATARRFRAAAAFVPVDREVSAQLVLATLRTAAAAAAAAAAAVDRPDVPNG